MQTKSSPTLIAVNPLAPSSAHLSLPAHLQRKIDARWKQWEPWVCMQLLRVPDYDPAIAAAEFARLRKRHSDHIVAFTEAGVPMRLIRKHRLDDPRITDELRAVLVRAARERQRKAWRRRHHPRDPMAQLWGDGIRNRPLSLESPNTPSPNPREIIPSPEAAITIASIKKHVSKHFHLSEMRDPDLQLRSHRHIITFPRQLAMYIARQLTTATLQEIGRRFGGMHHTTVLHSIVKIEEMRRTDKQLNSTITRLIELSLPLMFHPAIAF